MGEWWERQAANVLIVIAVLALVVVIVVQAAMLRSQGWGVPIGSVADWVQAVGTLAAFGALSYAAREWRDGQNERRKRDEERRDHEADQARLVIVQPREVKHPLPAGITDRSERDLVVSNRSHAAIFNLQVHGGDPEMSDVFVWENFGSESRSAPQNVAILPPDKVTAPLTVTGDISDEVPDAEYVSFEFTDANGRRWQRVGSGQPTRLA